MGRYSWGSWHRRLSRPFESSSASPSRGSRPSGEANLAARDDHRRAAYLHAVDVAPRGLGAGVENRRASYLGSLADLDLLAEGDATVPGKMDRQRPRGGTRGGILEHAARRREHAGLPGSPRAGETVRAHLPKIDERGEVRPERTDRLLPLQLNVNVKWAV